MNRSSPAGEATAAPATSLPTLLAGAGFIMMLLEFALPANGLIGLPITFFLKNRLHLSAQEVAYFGLLASVPLYFSFVVGFLRDRWSPFGAGDRGHLISFGLVSAALFTGLAFAPPTYGVLMIGVTLVGSGVLMAASAARGLTSAIGQSNALSGLAGAIVNLANLLPALIAYLLGGLLSQALEGASAPMAARAVFLVGGGLMLMVAAFGVLGPRRLLDAHRDTPGEQNHPVADIARLARHWPIYPALAIYGLWQFAPAMGTAMTYYLSSTLHATDAQVGQWFALFIAGLIPAVAAYGWLCRRFPLRVLLWAGALLGVPQFLPFLLAQTIDQALLAAVALGLLGGLAQVAYVDLAIRSCPKGLQGTMMMLLVTMYWVPVRLSDLWGTYLYDKQGGFITAVMATTVVYALILPVMLLVPRHLTAAKDGGT